MSGTATALLVTAVPICALLGLLALLVFLWKIYMVGGIEDAARAARAVGEAKQRRRPFSPPARHRRRHKNRAGAGT